MIIYIIFSEKPTEQRTEAKPPPNSKTLSIRALTVSTCDILPLALSQIMI